MLNKIQKIGNVVFLIVFSLSVIWIKIDYEKKLNDMRGYVNEQIMGVQYTVIESDKNTTLAIENVTKQLDILDQNILNLKKFVEDKLKKIK